MHRQIEVGQADVKSYFTVFQSDGVTPATSEAGGQPQISINGSLPTTTGISTLTQIESNKYFATLDPTYLIAVGDVILTSYGQTDGDSFEIVGVQSESSVLYQSYATVVEGNNYFRQKLKSGAWDNADHDRRRKALIEATSRINRLNYADDPLTTTFAFPRTGQDSVPQEIKVATFLIAYALLEGIDPDVEINNTMKELNVFYQARTKYNRTFIQKHILAGIPSAEAWQILLPYLADTKELDLERM